MKLQEIIKDSIFGTIATITGPESIDKAYSFIQHNLPVLKMFDTIVLSINHDCPNEMVYDYCKVWYDAHPNVQTIRHRTNLGRMFGTIQLEESLLNYIKCGYPNKNWLFKSSEDVLLSANLFEQEYKEVDFYYLPGFSFESKQKHADNLYEVVSTTPQTNFYVLNISNINNLYGTDIDDKKNIYFNFKKNNSNLQPWELNFDDDIKFDMETHLGRTTKNLSKEMLINFEEWEKLVNFVNIAKIGDPSHKNIMFERLGICHYHNWKDAVTLI